MATRDLPKSFRDLAIGWIDKIPKEVTITPAGRLRLRSQIEQKELEHRERARENGEIDDDDELTRKNMGKVNKKNLWNAFVSGAGLFSDGYVNNSVSTVNTCLKTLYGTTYTDSRAISNISAIVFVGTIVGQLSFGYISDHMSRKQGMMIANTMLIIFTLLCAVGTWGKNGSPQGLFAALTVFRFFLGIAIGAEYPTSSVIASEFANELPAGKRNRYFCWFTNFCIDVGFVVSAFVPLVCLWIFSDHHLTAVWRVSLGLGCIPPLALFFLRLKMLESSSFKKHSVRSAKKFPWWQVVKFYWFRLTVVSLIWFIYDFSTYSFSTYSSYILLEIVPGDDLYKNFGWNVVFNLFYIPGAFLGCLSADYIGPRLTIAGALVIQSSISFAMASHYPTLKKHIASFVVVFGFQQTFGEFGPGDNIGLLAAKTSCTTVRGSYYAIAAAVGKIGAFVGTYIFPIIMSNASKVSADWEMQAPFFVSAALCMFSAFLALFLCPTVDQDAIDNEDAAFIAYLKDQGYDLHNMGDGTVLEVVDDETSEEEAVKNKQDVQVDTNSKKSL
ncbi:glycerophosphoinositol permease [Hyphopichia burtonii NRRL Y-1933]|uniref:Glycerophosphoinositol permease n=1 Tax=Hyphopichia burtonii NRRL Y-1933 TaxID=984485 RepID=A0A1E4RT87_9ASCO|nr:glycerophosphoinositol permease [Hyphopichia burtonii NRRL Y-1933]ODV70504.1 glycerophosphoinositol permease [Hyphopichia burtonii NRRL Y-1933]